ncbi:cysteine peptidase family C39 domain-containing protein [Bacteroides fragilis]|nr:cysteine peptidase family C39 domain-containing protein [Bacteroides fragilis]
MNRNILSILFDELHVKYTKKYLSELIEGHPYKYNLYGFSQILTMYHVENKGVQISKDDIELLDAPFIAYAGHDIVVVKDLTREKIEYYWQRRWIQSSVEAFCEIWDGIVLLTETSSKSIEPDYKQHKWQELVSKIKKGAISVLCSYCCFCVCLLFG